MGKSRTTIYRTSYRKLDSMLRVIQWATGSVDRHAVAAVHDHPDLDLVGALVYSDPKAGSDVGAISGIGDVGVIATTNPDEIVALDADCVPMALESRIGTHGEDETDQGCLGTAMHAVHAVVPVMCRGAGHPHLLGPSADHRTSLAHPAEHLGVPTLTIGAGVMFRLS
jgi:hypothetical protein